MTYFLLRKSVLQGISSGGKNKKSHYFDLNLFDNIKLLNNRYRPIVEKLTSVDKFLVILMVFGLVICATSLFRGILGGSQVQVEYIDAENEKNDTGYEIWVDIQGAVISPGVYRLSKGARIKDVLIESGGYSALADREYCEKMINLAEELSDGQKIYIPILGEGVSEGYVEPNLSGNVVNVNTATIAELDTLWGVGPARADDIVKNRPYKEVSDLVDKGVLSVQIVEKNKEIITVY